MEQKHIRSEQEWMELIQECRASGLSTKEWCRQHSIHVKTFYNKVAILKKKASDMPASHKNKEHAPQEAVPIQILEGSGACMDAYTSAGNAPAVILNIQGYSIEIANHAARDTVFHVLSALQQLC